MPRLITRPLPAQAAGRVDLDPVEVPIDRKAAKAAIDRAALLSETAEIHWTMELSLDGGETWIPWGGATTKGGVVTDPITGLPATESSFQVPLPDDKNPQRRLRTSIIVNETVTTTVSVDVD